MVVIGRNEPGVIGQQTAAQELVQIGVGLFVDLAGPIDDLALGLVALAGHLVVLGDRPQARHRHLVLG